MKNKHSKRNLPSLLSICNLGPQVSVQSRDDDVFLHDEADVTIISYLIQAADDGRQVVRILTDDSDIFVLLVLGEALCSQLLGARFEWLRHSVVPFWKGQDLCSEDTKRRQLPRVVWCPW